MAYTIYTAPQAVVPATTITAAQNKLKSLCSIIFANRDFRNVDQEIADASKIRFGLMALSQAETDITAYYQIIEGLNFMCGIYTQQTVPTVS